MAEPGENRNNPKANTQGAMNTSWLIAIVFNASIAILFFLIFCYLCLKNSLRGKKNWVSRRAGGGEIPEEPYFTRKSIPNSIRSTVSSEKLPIYNIPTDGEGQPSHQHNERKLLSVNGGPASRVKTPISKFRAVGRLTGRIMTSSPLRGHNTMGTPGDTSFTESVPSSPAIYEPPIANFQDTIEDTFRTDSDNDETRDNIKNPLPGLITATTSNLNNNNNNHRNGDKIDENQKSGANKHEAKAETEQVSDKNKVTGNHQIELPSTAHQEMDKPSVLKSVSNRVIQSLRKDKHVSVSIQTSPTIWFGITGTVDLAKAKNGLDLESHPVYSDPFSPGHPDDPSERRYFIYLVTESSPYFRKNCIGKITLPASSSLTLSELRDYLLKSDDSSLREILRRNKSFRFLTETYRFVAQNEAIAPIDQVYPTKGIFIKLSAPDYAIMTTRNNRIQKDTNKFPSFINISQTQPPSEKSKLDQAERKHHHGMKAIKETLEKPVRKEIGHTLSGELGTSDPRKRCARPTCNKPAILGCIKCNNVFYCSPECKNEHYPRHRNVCSKPPWRF